MPRPSPQAKNGKAQGLAGRRVAAKTITQKGLLIVHTGKGKGKSTAAFGFCCVRSAWLALRRRAIHQGRLGHWRAAGARPLFRISWPGTRWARALPGRLRSRPGHGSGGGRLDQSPGADCCARDQTPCARRLNIALRYDYLSLAEVVAALRSRRPGLHIVVTGRMRSQSCWMPPIS